MASNIGGFTPGPWFVGKGGGIWRRDPAEFYENGGAVSGDKPLATTHRGWYDEGSIGFPIEANARLIAAAPELFAALQKIADGDEYEPCGWAVRTAQDAIAKVTGAQ